MIGKRLLITIAIALTASLAIPSARADTITFQGGLTSGGTPVNDTCDFEFILYDAQFFGTQIGPIVTLLNVSVSNGQFSVPLDFGTDAFDGTDRWVKVSVRCPAGVGGYSTLTPRQRITPAPQAHALVAPSTTRGSVAGGTAVRIENTSVDNSSFGVHGVMTATSGGGFSTGVRGENNSTSGFGIGVWGSQAGSGWGVYGTSVDGRGVYGVSTGNDGIGVYGLHSATSGITPGIHGATRSSFNRAIGVLGVVDTTSSGQDSIGVRGYNRGSSTRGIGVEGRHDGPGWGVHGSSLSGRGVYGTTGSGFGVYGDTGNGVAVFGTTANGTAMEAHGAGNANALYAHSDGNGWGAFIEGRVVMTDGVFLTNVPFGNFTSLQWDPTTKQIYQDNSSRRYKENIIPLGDDYEKILDAMPVTYTRPARPERWEIGFIAEQIDDLGLTSLVQYDAEGLPSGVRYDRISLYLVKVLRSHRDRVSILEDRVKEQQELIDDMKSQITDLDVDVNSVHADNVTLAKRIEQFEELVAQLAASEGHEQ